MKTLSKKQFKEMYESGELKLIQGGIEKDKTEILNQLNNIKHEIEKYTRNVSRYGDVSTSKDGSYTCNIFLSDCEDFIFVETIIDSSKDKYCSWNDVKTYNTVYLSC